MTTTLPADFCPSATSISSHLASAQQRTLPPQADRWFDDRHVSHTARWHQPLPDARALVDWARRTRQQTLALLNSAERRVLVPLSRPAA